MYVCMYAYVCNCNRVPRHCSPQSGPWPHSPRVTKKIVYTSSEIYEHLYNDWLTTCLGSQKLHNRAVVSLVLYILIALLFMYNIL